MWHTLTWADGSAFTSLTTSRKGGTPQARVYVYVCVYVRVSFWTTMS